MTTVRLRHLAQVNPPTPAFDRLADEDELTFLPMEAVWPGSRLDIKLRRIKAVVATGYTRFQDGDVLVPKITPTFEAGRAVLIGGLLGGVGAGTTELHVVRPGPRIDPRFLFYVVNTHSFLKLGAAEMYGVAGQQRVPDAFLRDLPVELPVLEEQRRIADFLDAEAAHIDNLVARRHRQSELMRERFESLTKSVTGRTALRFGTLPDGWSTQQLRRTLTSLKTGTTPSSDNTEIWMEMDGGTRTEAVPWYGPSNIEGLLELSPSVKYLPQSAITERVVPRFPSGSVLVIGIGATAGKVAYLDHEGTGNQQITALIPKPGMMGRFLAWQLWAATDELRELAPYTTLPIINNDFLKNFSIAVPPAAHQRVVIDRLDQAASRLRASGRATQQALSLLAERRQALITAAVTGQLDVTTASGRNVTDGVSA
ncbi:restriction endonuclease subunit S [Streptomyces sp. TG1A-60]|uniref:restriction endonuclease subunit S n=1 Tax=Streptomyces sp. TG1A-60 TaxID=3129111 RepID=UPI0030D269C7